MIGCLVAKSVTADIVGTIIDDGVLILAVVLVTVLVGGARRLGLTRLRVLPGTTAAWGSSPGGAAAMVAMSEEYGADPRLVAFMQYVRVVAVVLSASVWRASSPTSPMRPAPAPVAVAPLSVAGDPRGRRRRAGLAQLLRLPAFALTGPMLLGAALHASGLVAMALPMPLLDLAYATIGWYVGLRFRRETLRETLSALPGIVVATLGVIALCGGWAYGLTFLLPIDFLTAFLATSPGGLDSVAIIAVGSKVDVSFVLAVQTLRLFVVLVTGPVLAKWIARGAPAALRCTPSISPS